MGRETQAGLVFMVTSSGSGRRHPLAWVRAAAPRTYGGHHEHHPLPKSPLPHGPRADQGAVGTARSSPPSFRGLSVESPAQPGAARPQALRRGRRTATREAGAAWPPSRPRRCCRMAPQPTKSPLPHGPRADQVAVGTARFSPPSFRGLSVESPPQPGAARPQALRRGRRTATREAGAGWPPSRPRRRWDTQSPRPANAREPSRGRGFKLKNQGSRQRWSTAPDGGEDGT